MPYKKKSPLASFRDPQKMRRNFNPIDFKMPDLNSIYNKTANGSTVTEDQSTDNKTGSDKEGETPGLVPKSSSDKVLGNIQGTQENTEKKQSAAKQRKSEVREDRKKFNKAYRETRQAANMGSRFQTAEEKKKAQEAFGQMKGERNFKTKSLFANENPEDARGRLKEEARQDKINKAAKEDNFVQPSASLAKRPKSMSKDLKSGDEMKTKDAKIYSADGERTSDVFGRGRGFEQAYSKTNDTMNDDTYNFLGVPGDELATMSDSLPDYKKVPIYNNTRNNPKSEPTYGEKLKKQNKIANSDERAEMESTLNSRMKTLPGGKIASGGDKFDDRAQGMKKIPMPKPNITVNSIDDIGGGFDIPQINQNNTGSLKDRERSMFRNQFSNKAFPMVSRKGSAFPMVSDSPFNVVVNNPNQNRNQGVGTGSTVVTNTGTGTGGGGNGSGVTVSAGDGEVNTAITNADGVTNPSGGGNGSGSGVTNPSGGGNNTSAFGSGSVVAGGGDGTVSEVLDSTTGGNSLTYTGGGNTGNTGVQMPSNGLTGGTVAETIKTPESNSPRPTNYRPPNPPPIRREDTIGKDGQIFTPSRAGKGQKTMTNNVLPGISAGSVPSRGIQRDIQFNNKAMSAGELYAPPQPTGMNANTDASLNKTTQGTPMFAAFSDPKQIESNLKEDTENLNNAIDDNMSSVTKTISGMPKPGLEMNASRSSFAKSIDFGSLKKGALREELNVPDGEKIPLNKLETKPGDSKRTKQRKNLAKTMRGFKKG